MIINREILKIITKIGPVNEHPHVTASAGLDDSWLNTPEFWTNLTTNNNIH